MTLCVDELIDIGVELCSKHSQSASRFALLVENTIALTPAFTILYEYIVLDLRYLVSSSHSILPFIPKA